MERDCTTGGCGQPSKWGGLVSLLLSVCPVFLTEHPALALTNTSTKLGLCSHLPYVGVRILSVSIFYSLSPSPFLPHSPSLSLNLPPFDFYVPNSSSLFHLFSFFGFPIYFLIFFLWQTRGWLNFNRQSRSVYVCEQGSGGCAGNGRASFSLPAGRALEFHQVRTPLSGLCRQQWGTHREE